MSTTATQLPTGTWTIDPIHSTAAFRVQHMGVSTFRAGFDDLTGGYASDDAGVRLTGSVPVETISIKQPDLKGHVLAEDFLDAATYPTVTFTATKIEPAADGQVVVEGDLTIKATTKHVVATGTLSEVGEDFRGGKHFGLELTTELDRRDYGLDWQAEIPGGKLALDYLVTLEVVLELGEGA
jgi:polyisoprenoid-binding protein YceI